MAKANKTIVADICFYGNHSIGHGFIAQLADGRMIGDGVPVKERSATEALWLACEEIRKSGIGAGKVRCFMPGGQRMAVTSLSHPGYYGELKWEPAIQYAVSVEQLQAAAQ